MVIYQYEHKKAQLIDIWEYCTKIVFHMYEHEDV